MVTIKSGGSVTITASQPGNEDYQQAKNIAKTLVIDRAAQVISFPSMPVKAYGDVPFSPGATTNAPYAIEYSSNNNNIATINSSGKVVIKSPGQVTITAKQSGGASYLPATPVSQVLVIVKGTQTISFPPISNKQVGTKFKPVASASTGATVSFTSSNTAIAEVVSGSIKCKKVGTVTITAKAAASTFYSAATATTVLTVVAGSSRDIDITSVSNQVNGIQIPGAKDDQLTLYPNPVQKDATLRYISGSEGNITIRIVDANGRISITREEKVYMGLNSIKINSSLLKQGIYHIQVISADKKISVVKLVKIE